MSTNNNKIPTITLSNGVQMPQLALGTAPLSSAKGETSTNLNFTGFFPEQVPHSVNSGLSSGIRHIDTALIYRSHTKVAHVLNTKFMENKLNREDVFITSKIYHPPSTGFGMNCNTIDIDNLSIEEVEKKVHEQFEMSLNELGVGYVDLMLLHWPSAGGGAGNQSSKDDGKQMVEICPVNRAKRIAAWKVLEHYYSMGWTRAIGVSNFHEVHLQHLLDDGASIKPHVNQMETSVYIQHTKTIRYCKENDIQIMAFSPFGRGVMKIEDDEVIKSIATKYNNVSPGQIALAYLINLGYAVSFYSSSEERMKGNIEACSLKLDSDDMDKLSSLQRSASWGLPSPYSLS